MIDALIGCLLILGGAFAVIGSLGLVRMQDVLIRMHASSKIGTLSTGLTVLAAAIWFNDMGVTVRVILIVLFLLLTAPIASHMIGRAAVAIGVPLWGGKATDDDDLAID